MQRQMFEFIKALFGVLEKGFGLAWLRKEWTGGIYYYQTLGESGQKTLKCAQKL